VLGSYGPSVGGVFDVTTGQFFSGGLGAKSPKVYDLAATTLNGQVYVFGGVDASGVVSNQAFVGHVMGSDGFWTRIADLPVALRGHAAVGVNNKIYVFGGATCKGIDCSPSGSMFIYDPSTDTWTAGPPLPTPRHHFGVILNGTTIYAVGGTINSFAPGDTFPTAPANLPTDVFAPPIYMFLKQ
jgi:N-acetylneuraminic acid mutarotase